jgi:hypothetical protein
MINGIGAILVCHKTREGGKYDSMTIETTMVVGIGDREQKGGGGGGGGGGTRGNKAAAEVELRKHEGKQWGDEHALAMAHALALHWSRHCLDSRECL